MANSSAEEYQIDYVPPKAGGKVLRLAGPYPPILNIEVLQFGQVPFEAFLPFFIVTSCTFSASLLVRHLTQYICITLNSPPLKRILNSIYDFLKE